LGVEQKIIMTILRSVVGVGNSGNLSIVVLYTRIYCFSLFYLNADASAIPPENIEATVIMLEIDSVDIPLMP